MAKEQEVSPAVPALEHELVVIHPFGSYQRGDRITAADEIDRIKASENAHHCHKVFPQ